MDANSTELFLIIEAETGIEVTPETRLEDLPIDSLDFIELLHVIGERFGEIPDAAIAKINTVGDLLKAIP